MTLKEKAVLLIGVVAAFDEGRPEIKELEGAFMDQFTFRPCARNVTVLRKHMVEKLCEDDEDLTSDAAWALMEDVWDSVCTWAK